MRGLVLVSLLLASPLMACFETPSVEVVHPADVTPPPVEQVAEVPPGDPVLASMQALPLVSTRHGACRMECRKVDQAEVASVLATGTLDPERTRTDGECPSHAVEGRGTDGHRLRVVFAQCKDETRVVTVVDLDQDWPCGDC